MDENKRTVASDAEYRIIANRWQSVIESYPKFPREASALIVGDSGTGKELIARNLHHQVNGNWGDVGDTSGKGIETPFIAVNCALINKERMEDQLFGHEKGSFTGAAGRLEGVFQRAKHGTLFLDEIQELEPTMQGAILRAVEQREVDRIGAKSAEKVHCRIITGSSKNLPDESILRPELYYRLNQFPVSLAPLKNRGVDLVVLIRHFTEVMNSGVKAIRGDLLFNLMTWHWPGNVRELRSVIQYLCIASSETLEMYAFYDPNNIYGARHWRGYEEDAERSEFLRHCQVIVWLCRYRPKQLRRIVYFRLDPELTSDRSSTFTEEELRQMEWWRYSGANYSKVPITDLTNSSYNDWAEPGFPDPADELLHIQSWDRKLSEARKLMNSQKKKISDTTTSKSNDYAALELLRHWCKKDFRAAVDSFESQYLDYHLDRNGGNKKKAAEDCGLPYTTFLGRLKKHGL